MKTLREWSGVMSLGAAISIVMGLYRLLFYSEGRHGTTEMNHHVGGDAYNLIINGIQATAFFVLALILIVLNIGSRIVCAIEQGNQKEVVEEIEDEEDTNTTESWRKAFNFYAKDGIIRSIRT